MGGKARPGSRRVGHAERAEILARVSRVLGAAGIAHAAPPERSDKADHGDVDVVVDGTRRADARAALAAEFACDPADPFVASGEVDSFLTSDEHQLDACYCPSARDLAMHCAALANGDLGNLVTAFLGCGALVLSERGLHLRAPRLLLSDDPAAIAAFLRLPPDTLDGRTSLTGERLLRAVEGARFFCAAWAGGPPLRRLGGRQSTRRRESRALVVEMRARHRHRRGDDDLSAVDKERVPDFGVVRASVEASALDHFAGARAARDAVLAAAAERERSARAAQECRRLLGPATMRAVAPPGFEGPAVGAALESARAALMGGRNVTPDALLEALVAAGPKGVAAAAASAAEAAVCGLGRRAAEQDASEAAARATTNVPGSAVFWFSDTTAARSSSRGLTR